MGPGISPEQRLRDLIEEMELADQVGLDVFGVGEHHRPDFAVSSPIVPLAAGAARTERIRLTSAVTVLSSDDPVRVFQDFATLDLLSGGRAEIMAGRGSFTESFPLFGYDLDDYDELFAEKLDLLLELRSSERVTWSGRHRAPLHDQGVWPRPAMISARPPEIRSTVANSSNTRTGSSELSTLTALVRRIRSVCAAIAASATAGAETAKSGRWCSPTPNTSRPSSSASLASSSRFLSRCSGEIDPTSAKVISPSSTPLDKQGRVGCN